MKIKNRNFQVLRFIAAAIVLLAHISLYIHDRLDPNQNIFDIGKLGVVIFFTLSGTIMQLNYQEKKITWNDFIKARFVRVIPLYWFALICKLTIFLIFPSLILHSRIYPLNIVKSILLIPDRNTDGIQPILGVAWTLYFEVFFYIVFSFYILSLSITTKFLSKKRTSRFILEILLLGISFLSIFENRSTYAVYASSYLIFFYAGICLARFSHEGKKSIRKYQMHYFAVFCLLIIFFQKRENMPSPGTTLIYLGISVTVVAISIRLPNLSENRVGVFISKLGDASYSLYLFHPIFSPIIPALTEKIYPKTLTFFVFLITFGSTICLSYLVHRILEIPLLKFSRSLF